MIEDLQAIADGLAEDLGHGVSIEDARLRLLVHSRQAEPVDDLRLTSVLAREAPEPVRAWVARAVGNATGPVRLPAAPEFGARPRVCAPLRGHDGTLLGFLFVLDPDERVAPERCAAAAADAARIVEADRARRSAAARHVEALVSGGAEERRAAAQALGLPARIRILVAAPTDRGARAGALAAAELSGRAVAVVAADTRPRAAAPAGLGPAVAPADAGASYRAARHAADLAGRLESLGPLADWDALGAWRLLGDDGPGVARALLAPLDAHPELLLTAEAYLDLAGDGTAAAARLSLHRTSLYHRLRRVTELTGLDVHDGEDRLTLHLALRLRHL